MRKKIKVGRGFGKRTLDEAIRVANSGDTIVIDAGTYTYLNGLSIDKDITIIGNGSSPSDVTVHGKFWINGNKVVLRNFKVVTTDGNTINIKQQGVLNADQMLFEGEITGEYPCIWVEGGSKINLQSSEVEHHGNVSGIIITEGSYATISGCIIDSMNIIESSLQMDNSQLKTVLTGKKAIITGTNYIELLCLNQEQCALHFIEGTRAEFEQLAIEENAQDVALGVLDSLLKVDNLQIDNGQTINVKVTDKSTISMDESELVYWRYDEETEEFLMDGTETIPQQQLMQATQDSTMDDEDVQNFLLDDDADDDYEASEEEAQLSAVEKLQTLHGLTKVKDQIHSFIENVRFNEQRKLQGMKTKPITLHSLFLGNPGTGKTTVARLLGEVLAETGVVTTAKFVEVDRSDLVSEYIGKTAIQTQEILDSAQGGILFIDEAYSLYSDSQNDFGKEAVDTLLKYMEDHRDDVMIIFAGYTDKMQNFINMNPGLRSRVPNIFDFEDYSADDIADIGYKNLLDDEYVVNEEAYKALVKYQYSHSVDRSNARWVRNFNEKLLAIMSRRVMSTQDTDFVTIKEEDLDQLSGGNIESKQKKIDELLNKLNGMIGLDSIKAEVANLVKEAEVDKQLSKVNPLMAKPTYHMVFSGNPGTGKTTVAEIIAKLFNAIDILPSSHVKVVERSDLVGAYIGHTEKQTKAVIEEAMGGVLFIDEAYQLTQNSSGNDFGKQAVETLLTALENYRDKFIVIFAGYTKEMEEFLDANPGLRSRIPKKIEFPDYTPDEIAEIVHLILTKEWSYNETMLKSVISKLYANWPIAEKANGRWARNMADLITSRQKHYIIDYKVDTDHFNVIEDTLLTDIYAELATKNQM